MRRPTSGSACECWEQGKCVRRGRPPEAEVQARGWAALSAEALAKAEVYEPDSDLRDTENVPLKESVEDYFQREVLPHVPDAWIDHEKTTIGYEISFTRVFYKYQPLRSLDDIIADIMALEKETEGLLHEIVDDLKGVKA